MFHAYTLHTCFSVHSPYSYLVYTLQAHVWFKIFKFSLEIIVFMLTLSTHVSVFTLHTVIWFTLSKHILTHTLHICFSMQLFLHSPSRCYIKKIRILIYLIFSMLTLCRHVLVFTPQFAKQIFCLHSPSIYIRFQFFFIFTGFHFSHAYILQACSSVKSLSNVIIISSCALLNAPLNHECLTP